jgi:DNA-binding MarR family transcriptional regulator
LELFKEGNSTIPLQQVITFLHVALEPGIGITEVACKSQTHIASTSRHARVLRGRGGRKPALVVTGFGKDERTKPLLLTDEGRRLVNSILGVANTKAVEATQGDKEGGKDVASITTSHVAWDPFGATWE